MKTAMLWFLAGTIATVWLAGVSSGQDRDRGRDEGRSRGGFDPREMIERMDANRNGILEPGEASGRMAGFVRSMAERAGANPDQPIPIDRLVSGFEQMRQERERGGDSRERDRDRGRDDDDDDDDRNRRSSSSGSASSAPTGPQPFGNAAAEGAPTVPGFDVPLTNAASTEPLEKRFDRRVIEYVEENMLEEWDTNKNGVLERSEWGRGRWSTPPEESDLNKDGVLTKEELSIRMAKRFDRGSSRDSSSTGRREERSSSDSGSSPESSGFGRSGFGRSGFGGPGGPGFGGPSFGGPGGPGFGGPGGGPPGFGPPGGNDADRMRGFAESILRRYDDNRDGKIDREEMKDMRSEQQAADANKDGTITVEEMAANLQNYSRGGWGSRGGSSRDGGDKKEQAAVKKSYRFGTPTERLPAGLPDFFLRNDANADGQISMAEYATSWSDRVAAEFLKLDVNGDGILTPEECARPDDQ